MKLNFKVVRYKNFLSTGNVFNEIRLDSPGVTLVTGSNGCGKSTFLDALWFALYGVAYRNINKPQLVNNINKKDLLVEVELEVGGRAYLIRRGIAPTVFEIFENGKPLDQLAATRDQQAWLEQTVLNMTPAAAKQVVVLSKTRFVPFLELPSQARRTVIEDLIQLKVIGVMSSQAKQSQKLNTEAYRQNEMTLAITQESLASFKKMSEQSMQNMEELISAKHSAQTMLRTNIHGTSQTLDQKTKELTELKDKLEKMNGEQPSAKKQQLESMRTTLNTKLDDFGKNLEFFEANDTCPMCTQDIDHVLKHVKVGQLQEKIANANNLKVNVEEGLNKAIQQIKDREQVKAEVLAAEGVVSKLTLNIKSWEAQIKQIDQEIQDLRSRQLQFDTSSITETETKVAELVEEKKKLTRELTLDNAEIKMLEDDGIKADIVRTYIPIINKSIEHYLDLLDFPVGFRLDESFDGVVIGPTQDTFSYASFSEGEKGRIDLALLFAWREVALHRNSINTNLLIMDEVLDGSLDGVGADLLFEMFDAAEANILVITHRESFLDKTPNHIKFEKQGHFSRIAS